jgi:hypothetical protein
MDSQPETNEDQFAFDPAFLESRNITWDAKGMLIYLVSKQGEPTSLQELIDASPAGRDKVLNLLGQLETAGYIRKVRDTVEGRFQPTRYIINFRPEYSAYTQYVYLITDGQLQKIGMSRTPKARIRAIEFQAKVPITTLHIIAAENMSELEECLHLKFARRRISGEWFALDPDDVAWVQSLSNVSIDDCAAIRASLDLEAEG